MLFPEFRKAANLILKPDGRETAGISTYVCTCTREGAFELQHTWAWRAWRLRICNRMLSLSLSAVALSVSDSRLISFASRIVCSLQEVL